MKRTALDCRSAVKSNLRYRFTREARADVRDIRRYTAQQWGEHRRDLYVAQLQAGFARLASYPELGQERSELAAGCRAARIAQHIVYYRIVETELVISRVLHSSMDVTGIDIP